MFNSMKLLKKIKIFKVFKDNLAFNKKALLIT